MSLDRQAIEKRDFPISRRGYETLAVDAHLAQLAREVEALQAERPGAPEPAPAAATTSLASSASEQVRAIVQAAERSAAEIEQQATDDADRRRTDAASDADATRASAEADAQAHVSAVQGETRAMLERIQAVESLLEHLRTTAQEVQSGLDALHAQVGTLGGAAASGDGGTSTTVPEPVAAVIPAASADPVAQAAAAPAPAAAPTPAPVVDAVPVATPAPAPATLAEPTAAASPATSGETAGDTSSTDAASAAPATRSDDEAGARMVALSLVLDGVARDEIERHLDEHYVLADRAGLLDDLYARQAAQ